MVEDRRKSDEDGENYLETTIGTKEWGENTREIAYQEIKRICAELSTPDEVPQVANAIYNRSLDSKMIEWRNMKELSCASVLAACRTQKMAYSPNDISEATEFSSDNISKFFTELSNELGLEVGPVDPRDYVSRYVNELDLDETVEKKSQDILSECMEVGIHSGKSPSAFAGSAVYLSALLCNDKVTQEEVAEQAGANVETIRSRYQEQIAFIGEFGEHEIEKEN